MAAPHVSEHPPGKLIGGRYQVEGTLGRGGMGSVYRVRDTHTGEQLALKRSRSDDGARAARRRLFLEREFNMLAHLCHPRIIEVHEYGVDELGPYYTMELLDGGDLRELAPLPSREACRVMFEVGSALALLHSRRLVHRDITPRNIRCTRASVAKLIDFGAMSPMTAGGWLRDLLCNSASCRIERTLKISSHHYAVLQPIAAGA